MTKDGGREMRDRRGMEGGRRGEMKGRRGGGLSLALSRQPTKRRTQTTHLEEQTQNTHLEEAVHGRAGGEDGAGNVDASFRVLPHLDHGATKEEEEEKKKKKKKNEERERDGKHSSGGVCV